MCEALLDARNRTVKKIDKYSCLDIVCILVGGISDIKYTSTYIYDKVNDDSGFKEK